MKYRTKYTIKHLSIFILTVVALAGCHKRENKNEKIFCFGQNNGCLIDTFFYNTDSLSHLDSCHVYDAVNVSSVTFGNGSTANNKIFKINDLVNINLNALGTKGNYIGNAMFVVGKKNDHIEVKTFLLANTCVSGIKVLTPYPSLLSFKAIIPGKYDVQFLNVYGQSEHLEFTIIP